MAKAVIEEAHQNEQEQPLKEPPPTSKGMCPKCENTLEPAYTLIRATVMGLIRETAGFMPSQPRSGGEQSGSG